MKKTKKIGFRVMSSAADTTREIIPVEESPAKKVLGVVLFDLRHGFQKIVQRCFGSVKPLQRLLTVPIYLVDLGFVAAWVFLPYDWFLMGTSEAVAFAKLVAFSVGIVMMPVLNIGYLGSSRRYLKQRLFKYYESVAVRIGSNRKFLPEE